MSDEPDLFHLDVESTNPWPIRENLRTFPTFMPSFLARVRISCFRKTTFTSSPVPCNLLKLSEFRVKTLFFFVLSQLSDLLCVRGEGFTPPFPSPFVHFVLRLSDLSTPSPSSSRTVTVYHFIVHEICMVHKLPKPSVKAWVKEKWE